MYLHLNNVYFEMTILIRYTLVSELNLELYDHRI